MFVFVVAGADGVVVGCRQPTRIVTNPATAASAVKRKLRNIVRSLAQTRSERGHACPLPWSRAEGADKNVRAPIREQHRASVMPLKIGKLRCRCLGMHRHRMIGECVKPAPVSTV